MFNFWKKTEEPALEAKNEITLPQLQQQLLQKAKEEGDAEAVQAGWWEFATTNTQTVVDYERQLADETNGQLPEWYASLSLWKNLIEPMEIVQQAYADSKDARERASKPSERPMDRTDSDQVTYISTLEKKLDKVNNQITYQGATPELTNERDRLIAMLNQIKDNPLQAAHNASTEGGFRERQNSKESFSYLITDWLDSLRDDKGDIPIGVLETIAASRIAQNLGNLLNREKAPTAQQLSDAMDAGGWNFGVALDIDPNEMNDARVALEAIDEAMIELASTGLGALAETEKKYQISARERKRLWSQTKSAILNKLPTKVD